MASGVMTGDGNDRVGLPPFPPGPPLPGLKKIAPVPPLLPLPPLNFWLTGGALLVGSHEMVQPPEPLAVTVHGLS
jgi:hypothetical protein